MSFLTMSLMVTSMLTNLTVEGIKKLLDGAKVKYSSNLLAVITSMAITLAASAVYVIMNDITVTMKVGTEIMVLRYLSFLTSTVGYDKVHQTFSQIKISK